MKAIDMQPDLNAPSRPLSSTRRREEEEAKRDKFWEEFAEFYSDPERLDGLIDVLNTPHHSYDPEED